MECYLIGAGMGTEAMLTAQARTAIEQADLVLGTTRLADGLKNIRNDIEVLPFSALADRAVQCSGTAAILLSGDTGFFSAAKSLYGTLCEHGKVTVLPGMSSLQVFCAKIGTSYDDAQLMSVHGRQANVVAAVSYHGKVFALTGGNCKANTICKQLTNADLGHLTVHIGENLGAETERIAEGTAQQLQDIDFADLSVILIENPAPADVHRRLRDSDFVRGEVPMTKQEIRWLVRDLLSVHPEDVVYDIGAGTGSVTMDLARGASRGQVYAVECNPTALPLIRENRIKTGSYHVTVVEAKAPEGLEALQAPDCAFIGGSRGNMAEIVQTLLHKNPEVRLVISAIALETVHAACEALRQNGIQPEISCVNVSRAKKVGGYHMMTAQNPVYLIGGNLS